MEKNTPTSLKKRLILPLVTMVVMLFAVSSILSLRNIAHEMNHVADEMLAQTAARLLPIIISDVENRRGLAIEPDLGTIKYDDDFDKHHDDDDEVEFYEQIGRGLSFEESDAFYVETDDVNYFVRDASGEILVSGSEINLAFFINPLPIGLSRDRYYRYLTLPSEDKKYTITVFEPQNIRLGRQRGLRMTILLSTLFLGLTITALIFVVVNLAMRPVKQFGSEISERSASDLTSIDGSNLPREIFPVAQELNHLFERFSASLDKERRFARNAAHELRTPVAASMAQAQRLRQSLSGEKEKRAKTLEDSLKRLNRIIEKLLQLSKAQSQSVAARADVDLVPYVNLVVQDLHHQYPNVEFDFKANDGAVSLPIDPDAFAIVARNLLENAAKYGEDHQVKISLSQNGLSVENLGRPITKRKFERWCEAFERGQDNEAGTGLGLSIIQTIATSAGAELLLTSPIDGEQGVRISMLFDTKNS